MAQTPTSPPHAGSEPVSEPLFTANFLLACFITLMSFASFYLLLATLPVYIIQIGGSEAEVGLIIGVFSASALVLRLFVGKAADQHGRRAFIIVGTAILAFASGLYAIVMTVPLLLGLRVFHGAGWASFGTAASALVADVVPRSRRGEAMGYYGMFNNLAMAVGPALGVMLMNGYSFTVLFAASAALALISVVLSLMIREPKRPAHHQPPASNGLIQGMIEPTALFPSLVLALTAMTYASIVSFLPIYATRQGIDNPGVFFTFYAITLIVARGFTGKLSDRYGRASVVVPGLALAAAGLWLLSTAATLPVFLAVAFLYGLAFAAIQPAMMAMVVDRAAPNRRGAAMGTFSTAMDLGIGGGSFLWGFVAQSAGFSTMYIVAGGVSVLALAIFLVGSRQQGGTQKAHGGLG